MAFHEIQTIQCLTRQSFDDYFKIWEDIASLAKEQKCSFDWEVLSEKERTFRLDIKGHSQPFICVVFKALKICEEVV